jgi:RND family efflux transporter MFP subunit
VGGGAIAVIGLAGMLLWNVPGMTKPIKRFFTGAGNDVITVLVRSGALPITVKEKGALESSKNQDAFCNVEGSTTIISIKPEGTRVAKDEVVCELDSAALNDQLVNQRITTESAKANFSNATLTREVAEIAVIEYVEGIFIQDLATVEGEIKLAESELSRSLDRLDWARRMYEKGYVSLATKVSEELALKKSRFALEQAQSKKKVLVEYTKGKTIKELKSEVEKTHSDELAKKATHELEVSKEKKLERQIAACKIRAPSDGLVVYANDPMRAWGSNQPQIEEGAQVRERQKIFSLPDISKMQVNAKIHESHIDLIKRGLKAKVRVDAFSDQLLEGTVVDVAPLPDVSSMFSSDVKVYTAKVQIDNPLPGLRPGMNAEVEILVDRRENVLFVPVTAVLQFGGKDHLTKKVGDHYTQTEVELGPSNESYVQITKGAKADDQIVMSPLSLMTDEEKNKAFGSAGQGAKRDWAKRGTGEAEAKDAAGGAPAGALAKSDGAGGAPGKAGDPAKAKGKGRGARAKGKGGNRPAYMAKIPRTEWPKLMTASEDEKVEILKKAGLTADEIQQFQAFSERMRAGGGPGGGGFGGGRGGGGGPPGGGEGGGGPQQ